MVLCPYRGGDHEDFNSILHSFELSLKRKKNFATVHGFLKERARYLREGISLCSGTTKTVFFLKIVAEGYVGTQSKSSCMKIRLLHCMNS